MKNLILSLGLLSVLGCAHTPYTTDPDAAPGTTTTTDATILNSPTPNTGYERPDLDHDATIVDSEGGDIAPLVPCKAGEVERRQSGKVVCMRADQMDPNSTTGR